MKVGLNFFPAYSNLKSASEYFRESLKLAALGEKLGLSHIRTIEHYGHQYGGSSPNPLIFLTAVAMKTRQIKLITGALVPPFSHPFKQASEIAMTDALTDGRLEVGFARGFLPHEFSILNKTMKNSKNRFAEAIYLIAHLLKNEKTSFKGNFYQISEATCLPRPTQKPHPPFWIAAMSSEDSFEFAGRAGYAVMGIPMAAPARLQQLIAIYRKAWQDAGHAGSGKVMLAFHMFCDSSDSKAVSNSQKYIEGYLQVLKSAAQQWIKDPGLDDYQDYPLIIKKISSQSFQSLLENGALWIGSPETLCRRISSYYAEIGGFEEASIQINFSDLPFYQAAKSLKLFAREVLPTISLLGND